MRKKKNNSLFGKIKRLGFMPGLCIEENTMAELTFRFAKRSDVPLIFEFINELAEYKKLTDCLVTTENDLDKWIFQKEKAEVLFVLEDGAEVGFVLFFSSFPAYIHGAGIYIEALYIKPAYRGKGYGKATFQKLAVIAYERGCGRIEWCCLDWNPTMEFYRAIGAEIMDDLTVCRFNRKGIELLAGKNDTN